MISMSAHHLTSPCSTYLRLPLEQPFGDLLAGRHTQALALKSA
jgi:hypothetical protein